MLKNAFNIITEAVKSETSVVNNCSDKFAENELIETMDNLEEMDEEDVVPYTEYMINIFESRGTYFVEADDLVRLMKDKHYRSLSEAAFNVANHYSIDANNMAVVIESNDDVVDFIKEETKDKKKKTAKANGLINAVKDLKDNGIKVLKKPAKKNKSCKECK